MAVRSQGAILIIRRVFLEPRLHLDVMLYPRLNDQQIDPMIANFKYKLNDRYDRSNVLSTLLKGLKY